MNRKEANDLNKMIEQRMIEVMIDFEPMGKMNVSDIKYLAREAADLAWIETEKFIENEGS